MLGRGPDESLLALIEELSMPKGLPSFAASSMGDVPESNPGTIDSGLCGATA